MQDYGIYTENKGGEAPYLYLSTDRVVFDGKNYTVRVRVFSNVAWRVENGQVRMAEGARAAGIPVGELVIEGGDFRRCDPVERDVFLILSTMAGAWKNAPVTGVGLSRYRHSAMGASLEREITVQLHADGYTTAKVKIKDDIITITL